MKTFILCLFVFVVVCFTFAQAKLDADFLGAYMRRSSVDSCGGSNCIKKIHEDGKKCAISIFSSPGFKPCKRDRKFWLLSRLHGELSYLWHKSMERCWSAEEYISSDIDKDYDLIGVDSFPPACVSKVKKEVEQCNKQLMKCPRYKECFNRLDNVLTLAYKKDVVNRLTREIKSCYKNTEEYSIEDDLVIID